MTEFIQVERNNGLVTVWLNRPEKKNALNRDMIVSLLQLAQEFKEDSETDIIVLSGRGTTFCAGADLTWFKEATELPEPERIERVKPLAELLETWYHLPQTTITVGHGFMYGGALGLLAMSDFVILEENSHLRLSEVALGFLPASISPFLLKRMGISRLKSLTLSSDAFNAQQALNYALADVIVPMNELSQTTKSLIQKLQKSAPETRKLAKSYLFDIEDNDIDHSMIERSAKGLAQSIGSQAAQERLSELFKSNQK